MNIDLFLTQHGESGLLCDRPFKETVCGGILDAETHEITLEFGDMGDTFHLNIPLEEELKDLMLFSHKIHIGILKDGLISESLQVPLLYLNDPFGGEFTASSPLSKRTSSLIGFESFMKRCIYAQPIHREDLGDENSSGSVLKGMDPRALQFVPQLVRQRMLEAAPQASQEMEISPFAAPGPSLGPGGSGGQARGGSRRVIKRYSPKDEGEDD